MASSTWATRGSGRPSTKSWRRGRRRGKRETRRRKTDGSSARRKKKRGANAAAKIQTTNVDVAPEAERGVTDREAETEEGPVGSHAVAAGSVAAVEAANDGEVEAESGGAAVAGPATPAAVVRGHVIAETVTSDASRGRRAAKSVAGLGREAGNAGKTRPRVARVRSQKVSQRRTTHRMRSTATTPLPPPPSSPITERSRKTDRRSVRNPQK